MRVRRGRIKKKGIYVIAIDYLMVMKCSSHMLQIRGRGEVSPTKGG